jgi:acyl-CoA dehydrogenase
VDFTRSDDHQRLRDGIRALCAKFGDDYWRQHDTDHEFPTEFYDALAADGWIGVAIPEEFGGGGQGITEASIILEEIAASGAGMNGCSAVHLSIFGMNPIVKHGSQELKEAYLPEVASGRLHVAFGVTEPNSGSDTTAITTRAVRDGENYVVNGAKVWTTKATLCDKVLLLVRTTPLAECEKRTDGMTLLFADLQVPQVRISPIPKTGRNAVVSCETVYEDLVVPVSHRVGEEGRGFKYLLDGLNPERILIASEALGLGRVALARAVNYAKERIVFGRPIGKNQGIAFPLAEAHGKLSAAELMIRHASWRYDNGLPTGENANLAKYLAAEAAFFAADRAMQTHGGFGYAIEYDVERFWKEARLMKIAPIAQEMILNYVAEHVLGLPRSY